MEHYKEMPGIEVVKPMGAFYIFQNIRSLGRTPQKLTEYLLDKAQIAVVPGTTLGKYGKDFIRISYANTYENLEVAMERMKRALKKIES